MFKKYLLCVPVVLCSLVLIFLTNCQLLGRVISTQKATGYRILLLNKSNVDQQKEVSDEKVNLQLWVPS